MEHQEPNDPELEKVWELLNSAKTVEPSPFFSRNVLREVRRIEDEGRAGWLSQVKAYFSASALRPAVLSAATCAAVALAVVLTSNPDSVGSSDPVIASAAAETEEFDPATEMAEVEYFGQLMAVADPAMLDDASIANLFF